MLVRITIFLSLLLVTSAQAQDDFNIEETVEICSACHGEEGTPEDTEYPIIWGQQYFYIYTQLKDYEAGRRENEIMSGIVEGMTRDQMKAVAQHFSEKEWPAIQVETEEGDARLAELGITGGQCSACHGKWQGDSRIPRMSGQNPAYSEKTMQDFKHDVRNNAPDKNSTMQRLDDETIAALARYLGSL
jgi:cytochrome c553